MSCLAHYEQWMRAHVVDASPLIRRSVLRPANPRTRAGVRGVRSAARVIASPVGQTAMKVLDKRFTSGAADSLRLPDYQLLAVASPAFTFRDRSSARISACPLSSPSTACFATTAGEIF